MSEYKIATIHVSGVDARVVDEKTITQSITGAVVEFVYDDPLWAGLIKNVVFEGTETVAVPKAKNIVELPPEVAGAVNQHIRVGVCGVDAEGTTIIPTRWACLGSVYPGAAGSFPPPAEKHLPVWAQLQVDVNALNERVEELEDNPPGGGLAVTDDGEGNVAIAASGSTLITDDGSGNVVIG